MRRDETAALILTAAPAAALSEVTAMHRDPEAIAGVMGTTLLLAWTGETFALGSTPIWVRQAAAGLSLNRPDQPAAH